MEEYSFLITSGIDFRLVQALVRVAASIQHLLNPNPPYRPSLLPVHLSLPLKSIFESGHRKLLASVTDITIELNGDVEISETGGTIDINPGEYYMAVDMT